MQNGFVNNNELIVLKKSQSSISSDIAVLADVNKTFINEFKPNIYNSTQTLSNLTYFLSSKQIESSLTNYTDIPDKFSRINDTQILNKTFPEVCPVIKKQLERLNQTSIKINEICNDYNYSTNSIGDLKEELEGSVNLTGSKKSVNCRVMR